MKAQKHTVRILRIRIHNTDQDDALLPGNDAAVFVSSVLKELSIEAIIVGGQALTPFFWLSVSFAAIFSFLVLCNTQQLSSGSFQS